MSESREQFDQEFKASAVRKYGVDLSVLIRLRALA